MDIKEHLTHARRSFDQIEKMTRSLGEAPPMDDVDSVVRLRENIVADLAGSAGELEKKRPGWAEVARHDPALCGMLAESKTLLGSIAGMDAKLAALIESKMRRIKKEMSLLYKTSRAACSYAAHSTLRVTR
jgi:hypothetical protein